MGYYFGCGNGGMGFLGGLLMFIFWVLVIIFIVWLIRHTIMRSSGSTMDRKWMSIYGGRAIDVLKERYAKGEIDKKEFEEKKKDLEG